MLGDRRPELLSFFIYKLALATAVFTLLGRLMITPSVFAGEVKVVQAGEVNATGLIDKNL